MASKIRHIEATSDRILMQGDIKHGVRSFQSTDHGTRLNIDKHTCCGI
jgi:hypothetical protein